MAIFLKEIILDNSDASKEAGATAFTALLDEVLSVVNPILASGRPVRFTWSVTVAEVEALQ